MRFCARGDKASVWRLRASRFRGVGFRVVQRSVRREGVFKTTEPKHAASQAVPDAT